MTKTANKSSRTTTARKSSTPVGDAIATSAKVRPRRTTRKVTELTPVPPPTPVTISKQAQLAALLIRDEGATLDEMIALTGWLPHTTRAALTGLRTKGYVIDSDKTDGMRTYRAVAPK